MTVYLDTFTAETSASIVTVASQTRIPPSSMVPPAFLCDVTARLSTSTRSALDRVDSTVAKECNGIATNRVVVVAALGRSIIAALVIQISVCGISVLE
jgi:hypothetical protein